MGTGTARRGDPAVRRGKKPGGEPDAPETLDLAERVEVAVRNTARGLARLLELAAPTGARVHFVLQPTIAWTGKRLSPEEKALIEENDRERRHMFRRRRKKRQNDSSIYPMF